MCYSSIATTVWLYYQHIWLFWRENLKLSSHLVWERSHRCNTIVQWNILFLVKIVMSRHKLLIEVAHRVCITNIELILRQCVIGANTFFLFWKTLRVWAKQFYSFFVTFDPYLYSMCLIQTWKLSFWMKSPDVTDCLHVPEETIKS